MIAFIKEPLYVCDTFVKMVKYLLKCKKNRQ